MIETINISNVSFSLYYLFWFIGVICVLVIGYWLGKGFGFTFAKSVSHVVVAVLIGLALLWGVSWVLGGGKLIGLNFVRIVTFMPISVFVTSRILKDPFWKVADFIAPLLAIFHGVTHIGCIFPGCCHGYPASWGLFSNAAGAVCFPTQPIESVSSIAIGIVLIIMHKRGVQKGRLYPWYLFLFGTTRFIWEFLRDNEKVWHGLSELALHALVAAILGFIALAFMQWRSKRSDCL